MAETDNGIFWSSTEDGWAHGWCRELYYANDRFQQGGFKKGDGLSVRCLRD